MRATTATIEYICAELEAGRITAQVAVGALREREQSNAIGSLRLALAKHFMPRAEPGIDLAAAVHVRRAFQAADALIDFDRANPRP